jgi:hypothetical protein
MVIRIGTGSAHIVRQNAGPVTSAITRAATYGFRSPSIMISGAPTAKRRPRPGGAKTHAVSTARDREDQQARVAEDDEQGVLQSGTGQRRPLGARYPTLRLMTSTTLDLTIHAAPRT